MPNYETLDSIADAYIPLLATFSLVFIVVPLLQSRRRIAALRLLAIALLLVSAYGLMFLDARLNIWALFDLDFSTHTAVALIVPAWMLAAFLERKRGHLRILVAIQRGSRQAFRE